MDIMSMDPNADIRELLQQQLDAVNKVVAFNHEITKRLSDRKVTLGEVMKITETSSPIKANTADLEEPLIKKTIMPSRQQSPTVAGGASLFPSAEQMKRKLEKDLDNPYNVEDFYYETGICQRIAKNLNFQNMTMLVILLNTFWIAYDTDTNTADVLCQAPIFNQIVDNLFCIYFTFEVSVRFLSFKHKGKAFKDAWWVFDATLVTLMVWETWINVALFLIMGGNSGGAGKASILRIFRMFRLLRVARMARLLRYMPELTVMIKGMIMAMRSVAATLLLLVLIIYIFAILFRQLLGETGVANNCFATVPSSMDCLMMYGVFTEQKGFIWELYSQGVLYYILIILYLVIGSLTVCNMLIGVICETVHVVAEVETEKNKKMMLKEQMVAIVRDESDDAEDSIMVTREKFCRILERDDAVVMLNDHFEVDFSMLEDMPDYIFGEQSELTIEDFMKKLLHFRGSNTATVRDVTATAVSMRKIFTRSLRDLKTDLSGSLAK